MSPFTALFSLAAMVALAHAGELAVAPAVAAPVAVAGAPLAYTNGVFPSYSSSVYASPYAAYSNPIGAPFARYVAAPVAAAPLAAAPVAQAYAANFVNPAFARYAAAPAFAARAYAAPVVAAAPVARAYSAPLVNAPVVAAPVARAVAPVAPVAVAAPLARLEEVDAHPQYQYAYTVQDELTGDSKSQEESRDGGVVRGSYSLVEPDGNRRTVNYYADPVNGFNAVVTRDAPLAVAAPLKVAPAAVVAV